MALPKKHQKTGLAWPKLIQGTLIKRYKRFMADVRLHNGHIITAHCPNSGSMLGCSEPGRPVYISRHDHAHRRLKYTWEIIDMPSSWVGVNTMVPNRLIKQAITDNGIDTLSGYETIRAEVPYGERSRIDILLEKGHQRCFIEIKNCSLIQDRIAYFPDAVTSRGLKHLKELQNQVRLGHRSVMVYLVQRMDADAFQPAHHIDPEYAQGLQKAAINGVEILVYDVKLDLEGITLRNQLPYTLE
jgi:sugar fermentation stimulation protein A